MRRLVLPLSALLCLSPCIIAQVEATPANQYSPDLKIPAILQKAVKAEKVRPGDEVQFESVEAVLLHDGIVLPAGGHLYGHVLESEPLESSSESRLSIEVDRAEWGHKKVTLHAFISGVGVRRQILSPPRNSRCTSYDPDVQVWTRSSAFDQSNCSMEWRQDPPAVKDFGLSREELKLQTNLRDGSTALVSKKKNIHLPGGLLIMLHNVPVKNPEPIIQAQSQ